MQFGTKDGSELHQIRIGLTAELHQIRIGLTQTLLKQDVGWYDTNKSEELSSRVAESAQARTLNPEP